MSATTIDEILEQVKQLSHNQRKELTKQMIDLLDNSQPTQPPAENTHWGRAPNQLLDELGPIDLIMPEIEDPVEWVKALRDHDRKHRLGDLDE